MGLVELTAAAGKIGGHVGGSLSMMDMLAALYFRQMNIDPSKPDWPERDRLILSKGHAAMGLYVALAKTGFFSMQELLDTYNKLDSKFGKHCDMNKTPGVEACSGSLGHGLSIGIGMALAARHQGKQYRVYVVMGDGEMMEGSVWESAMAGPHFELGNLTAIIDRNQFCIDGPTEEIMTLEPLGQKWRDFGWNVFEIDGHDMSRIVATLDNLPPVETGVPTAIVSQTVKGKGVSIWEGDCWYHYGDLVNPEEKAQAFGDVERELTKAKEAWSAANQALEVG
jgi:transketolase